MSNRSASAKCASSWLAEEVTIRSFEPAGMSMPPTCTSLVARRRQAATEPLWRRHSSTALEIRPGSSQMSRQACGCCSSSFIALAVALAVVSCAATMPAIIIECR
jgi:D-serine deaminase-like pyridoxal phosphate-dependent protein